MLNIDYIQLQYPYCIKLYIYTMCEVVQETRKDELVSIFFLLMVYIEISNEISRINVYT